MSITAKNPILPGFYPDPSICAVGEDFYLVNSSFAYFPGLPIMHSRDLANWEQIGNIMDREEQLPLKGCGHSQGLFAPTIRYHKGVFYVVCTNISGGGNYVVTAENPSGPWSNPYYLAGADGIDPSLFFDDDGKCYYIGTHPNPAGCSYNGDYYIWIQELDLERMQLVGEVYNVWNGAMRNVAWPEGPHLYKKDGWYYIMHAEGGTGPDHAVTVCRSRSLLGPYENNPCNPILTHRHLGQNFPIRYVGHGDLVQTVTGEWYMVMLAVRPLEGYTTMGRETFLARVIWENDWPVVNPGIGMLTEEVEIDLPLWERKEQDGRSFVPRQNVTYDFGKQKALGSEFLALRNPRRDILELVSEKGLALRFQSITLKEQDSPSYLAVRQQHHRFEASARMWTETLTESNRAGLALVQSNRYHLRVELGKAEERSLQAEVILCRDGKDETVSQVLIKRQDLWAETVFDRAEILLRVEGLTASAELRFADEETTAASPAPERRHESVILCRNLDIRDLSTEVAGGFVGCTVGMYAAAERDTAGFERTAMFERFSYREL